MDEGESRWSVTTRGSYWIRTCVRCGTEYKGLGRATIEAQSKSHRCGDEVKHKRKKIVQYNPELEYSQDYDLKKKGAWYWIECKHCGKKVKDQGEGCKSRLRLAILGHLGAHWRGEEDVQLELWKAKELPVEPPF